MSRGRLLRGAWAGAVAGAATAAAMYAASALAGLRPLPELLQQPLLSALPGPVFGFLIDRLQHAGKVLEELGLLVAFVAALTALGAGYGAVAGRRPHLALAFGAAGWVAVCLVLLPVSGDGFLGLGEGVTAPVLWALLFALYALVLELSFSLAAPAPASEGRRAFIGMVPVLVGGLSLAVLGARLLPGWYQAVANPPEAGLQGPVPELTPPGNFYVVSKNFQDPVVPEAGWALHVRGAADSPYQLTAAELRALPSVTQPVTLECVSNDVGGDLISTGRFTGVSLRDLVRRASPRPGVAAVNFRARDGYTESLPLSLVLGAPEILVAYDLDGAPLPPGHGFPARVVIPGRYGMKGPKWLDEISLAAQEQGGYWEEQGWDRQAVVKTTARIDSPREGDILKGSQLAVAGVAFAGTRGIAAVEVSTDGGATWSPAQLTPPLGPLTWTLWTFPWTPQGEGAYTLKARARDGSGALQPSQQAPSFPSGASGYHAIRVNVAR